MPHAQKKDEKTMLTREERRARRELRREKQRKDNIGRAANMHAARLQMDAGTPESSASSLKTSVFVGCSGWFYWKWRELFYPADLPTGEWFKHYAKRLDTVEMNASFYSWPTVANVKAWKRQPGKRSFVYTVKVCELITHIKKFKGTKTLVKDFGMIADILGTAWDAFYSSFHQATATRREGWPRYSASSIPPGVTSSNFVTQVGGMRRYTPRFARPARFSALAAAQDSPTSLSGLPTTSTCACTASNAVPATPEELDETVRLIKSFGRRARHNHPRIGRIVIAKGRDAADVAISTAFGPARLVRF